MGLITKIILLLFFSLLITVDAVFVRSLISLALVMFGFLSSPRCIVMNDNEISYNLGWKEKWSNVNSFEVNNSDLTLFLLNGRNRKIKNISPNDLDRVVEYISLKIQRI